MPLSRAVCILSEDFDSILFSRDENSSWNSDSMPLSRVKQSVWRLVRPLSTPVGRLLGLVVVHRFKLVIASSRSDSNVLADPQVLREGRIHSYSLEHFGF